MPAEDVVMQQVIVEHSARKSKGRNESVRFAARESLCKERILIL